MCPVAETSSIVCCTPVVPLVRMKCITLTRDIGRAYACSGAGRRCLLEAETGRKGVCGIVDRCVYKAVHIR